MTNCCFRTGENKCGSHRKKAPAKAPAKKKAPPKKKKAASPPVRRSTRSGRYM